VVRDVLLLLLLLLSSKRIAAIRGKTEEKLKADVELPARLRGGSFGSELPASGCLQRSSALVQPARP